MKWMRNLADRLLYSRDPALTGSPARRSMDLLILQTAFFSAFSVFTGGIYLTGYLLFVGAPDYLVSYVPVLGNVCSILLVLFSTFVDRQEYRKKVTILFSILSKVLLFLLAWVPFVYTGSCDYLLVFLLLAAGQTAAAVSSLAYNIWYNALIPEEIRGRYFSARQLPALLVSLLLPVAAGKLLDSAQQPYYGFALLFTLGAVCGGLEVLSLSRIEDVRVGRLPQKAGVFRALLIPLKNREFMRYTLTLCAFYLFLYLSASFNQVYLVKYLGMSYTEVSACSLITSALQLLVFYRFWGRFNDMMGAGLTLQLSIGLYAVESMCWVLAGEGSVRLIYPLICVILGVETPAFSISMFSRRYEIIPEEGRAVYDTFFSCAVGVVLLVSPLLGELLRGWAAGLPLPAENFWGYRLIYLLSAVLLLALFPGGLLQYQREKRLGGRKEGSFLWNLLRP